MRRYAKGIGTVLVEVLLWLIDKRWGDALFGWLDKQTPEWVATLEAIWDYGLPLGIGALALFFFWQGWRTSTQESQASGLQYLPNRDSELSEAIKRMAVRSAHGRWQAAQRLVISGNPIDRLTLVHNVTYAVTKELIDGHIEVRGRRPDGKYDDIPREEWRNAHLYFVADSIQLEKMLILPMGATAFGCDGSVESEDKAAEQKIEKLREYDSLLVDSAQFEKVFPRRDAEIDKTTKRLLWTAKSNDADVGEIRRLAIENGSPWWSGLR